MMRILPPTLAVLLIVGSGVVHGVRTNRWGLDPACARAGERLLELPATLDEWEGQDLASTSRPSPEIAGEICRRYVQRRTGQAVTVYVVCGQPGPIGIHTPDVCYSSSGYNVGPAVKFVPSTETEVSFWTADMIRTRAADQSRLRVFWAWAADTPRWLAADNARFEFAAQPVLYKMYLIRELPFDGDAPLDRDPCVQLMSSLLPALQTTLFSSN